MRLKFICSVVLALIVSVAPPPKLVFSAEEYDPLHTISALNMAAVSISRILSTQDRIVLDQEYQSIMNNLNIGNIRPDSEIMELYRRILDTISRKRLRSEESEFLQARYDSEMKNTISQVVSAVAGAGTAIAVNGGSSLLTGNVYGALGSIADGVMSGYFIYQDNSSVRNDIDRDLWKLKAEEITDMNEIQKQLLTSSWNLLNQYKLPDSARLAENAIKEFYQAAETQDVHKRLRMLRALEKDFRVYPPYWYYRAKAARESGDSEESRKCLDEFAGVWRPVLRQDPYMLEVCKFRIHDLLSSDKPAAEIRADMMKYADLAAEHTPRSDWADNLFLGTVYFALGDKEKGIESVRLNDDFGHEKQISAAVVRQMESGTLDFAELAEELKDVLNDEKIIPLGLLARISAGAEKLKSIETSRKGFMSLYAAEWKMRGFGERLAGMINTEFEENTKALKWWKFQFTANPSEVQEKVSARFAPVYESFLAGVQKKYYSALGTDLRERGAKDFAEIKKQGEDTSANRAWWEKLITSNENTDWMLTVITILLINVTIGTVLAVIPIVGPIVGLIGTIGMVIYCYLFSDIALWQVILLIGLFNLIQYTFALVLFPISIILQLAVAGVLYWVMYNPLNGGIDTAKNAAIQQSLLERNQAIYTTELPAKYWAEIEPYIKKAINTSHD